MNLDEYQPYQLKRRLTSTRLPWRKEHRWSLEVALPVALLVASANIWALLKQGRRFRPWTRETEREQRSVVKLSVHTKPYSWETCNLTNFIILWMVFMFRITDVRSPSFVSELAVATVPLHFRMVPSTDLSLGVHIMHHYIRLCLFSCILFCQKNAYM
jgi:hypothetical protein